MKTKILVVEDEIDIKDLIVYALENKGYDLTSTDDGETITGSVFIIELENLEAAKDFTKGDPYRKMGLFEIVEIEEVKKVFPVT